MGQFITYNDFTGDYKLPVDYNQAKLDETIGIVEKLYLLNLLGLTEYKVFIANIVTVTPDQKWVDFRDGIDWTPTETNIEIEYEGIKEMLVAFAYYNYVISNDFNVSGFGDNNVENSRRFTTLEKKEEAYKRFNKGIDLFNSAVYFITSNKSTYPNIFTVYKSKLSLIKY